MNSPKVIPPPADTNDTVIVNQITIPAANSFHLNTIRILGGIFYLGGENGLLLRGQPNSFTLMSTPIQFSLWDVNTAGGWYFAFCADGYILRSSNGSGWDTVFHNSPYVYKQSVSDGVGRMWVVGTNSPLFLATPPNYNDWHDYGYISNPRTHVFSSIGFHAASGNGYLTSNVVTWSTTNNGQDWVSSSQIDAAVNDILFLSSTEMLVACDSGVILHSTDFGATWAHTNSPGAMRERMNRIVKMNDYMYIAVSSYVDDSSNRRGRIWYSHDKLNWIIAADLDHEVRDIDYSTTLGAYVCGTNAFYAQLTNH